MGLFRRGRANIVITNRHLRYADQSLKQYGEIELPEGTIVDGVIADRPALQAAVTKLVKKNKWRRRKLFFTVPDDTVVIRELEIPALLSEEEALGYVQMQLGKSFYLPFTNPALALDLLAEHDDKQDALIYAYPKDQVQAFKDVFADAGLRPVVADLTAFSAYRYYYHHLAESEAARHILLLHWNIDALVITAFNQDKAVFSRYVTYAERLGEACDTLAINEARALELINDLLVEVNRILDFYHYSIMEGAAAITGLLVSGDFPFLELAKQRINDEITIPIEPYHPEASESLLPLHYIDVLGLPLKKED